MLQKALASESRVIESRNSQKSLEKYSNLVYMLGCEFYISNDENKEVYAAECLAFQKKPHTYSSLKPIHSNWLENMRFTLMSPSVEFFMS